MASIIEKYMLRFFDFLFLRIYKFYEGFNEKGAQSSAAGAIGFFIAANILTVLMMVSLILRNKDLLSNKIYIILGAIFFQIIFHIRYVSRDIVNIPLIREKWQELSDNQKNTQRYYAITYVVLSVLGLMILAVYLGTQDW